MERIGWIMALKSESVRALVEQRHLRMYSFDERTVDRHNPLPPCEF